MLDVTALEVMDAVGFQVARNGGTGATDRLENSSFLESRHPFDTFTHGMCVLDDPSDGELLFEAAQQAERFRQGAKRLVFVIDVIFRPGVRLPAGLAGTDPVVLASLTQSQSTGRAMSCPGGFAAVTTPGA